MLGFLFVVIGCISVHAQVPSVCRDGGSNYLPIALPESWTNGSIDCFKEGALRPDIDSFPINNDTYILRENKCINYEAPFMYLLFGNDTVLLIDSGATVSFISLPIEQYVETLILHWCVKHGKEREDVDLVVAHTHSHQDHTAGDEQFKYKLFTSIVNTTIESISQFFKIDNWPNSIGSFDLDDRRHLAIVPIPGHEDTAIAFYDCATGLLFTGDTLLPGRLYISNFSANVESISRLVNFININRLNLTHIFGAHIEMTNQSTVDYPTGATYQPQERQLEMTLAHLHQLNNELQEQSKAGFNERHKAYYDAFIVDPNPSQLPPLTPDGRISEHGFILLPLDRTNYVWLSHKPMFRSPHDFQLVLLATIINSTISPVPLPTNISLLNNQWTLEPERWSLNNLINGNITSFSAKLFLGNSEQGGTYLCNITLQIIQPLLTVVQLNGSEVQPYQPLRYISYLQTNSTMSSKSFIHLYLLHQIRVQPDFDAIVHVVIDPANCTTDIDRTKLGNLLEQNGNEWAFHGITNDIGDRLTPASGVVRAQLLGDIYSTSCKMLVIEEIQCTIGPDFDEDCNV